MNRDELILALAIDMCGASWPMDANRYRRLAAKAYAAIESAGFAVVPVEPTEAMRAAGWEHYKDVGDIWDAMIEAASQ